MEENMTPGPSGTGKNIEVQPRKGNREKRPKVKYTPSDYEVLKQKKSTRPPEETEVAKILNLGSTEFAETPINAGGNTNALLGKRNRMVEKQNVGSDSEEEIQRAKQYKKTVKKVHTNVILTNDLQCLGAALKKVSKKKVTFRGPPKAVPVSTSATQTLERGPTITDETLGREIDRLNCIINLKDEEINSLKSTNEVLRMALATTSTAPASAAGVTLSEPETTSNSLTLQGIRDVIVQEIEPIKMGVNILTSNIGDPADTALRTLGNPIGKTSHAGVSISNTMLAKAKATKKLSSRITYLTKGYWSSEDLPFLQSKKRKGDNAKIKEITEEDVLNITRILQSLQMYPQLKLEVSEKDLSEVRVRHYILEAVKGYKKNLKNKDPDFFKKLYEEEKEEIDEDVEEDISESESE